MITEFQPQPLSLGSGDSAGQKTSAWAWEGQESSRPAAKAPASEPAYFLLGKEFKAMYPIKMALNYF